MMLFHQLENAIFLDPEDTPLLMNNQPDIVVSVLKSIQLHLDLYNPQPQLDQQFLIDFQDFFIPNIQIIPLFLTNSKYNVNKEQIDDIFDNLIQFTAKPVEEDQTKMEYLSSFQLNQTEVDEETINQIKDLRQNQLKDFPIDLLKQEKDLYSQIQKNFQSFHIPHKQYNLPNNDFITQNSLTFPIIDNFSNTQNQTLNNVVGSLINYQTLLNMELDSQKTLKYAQILEKDLKDNQLLQLLFQYKWVICKLQNLKIEEVQIIIYTGKLFFTLLQNDQYIFVNRNHLQDCLKVNRSLKILTNSVKSKLNKELDKLNQQKSESNNNSKTTVKYFYNFNENKAGLISELQTYQYQKEIDQMISLERYYFISDDFQFDLDVNDINTDKIHDDLQRELERAIAADYDV